MDYETATRVMLEGFMTIKLKHFSTPFYRFEFYWFHAALEAASLGAAVVEVESIR